MPVNSQMIRDLLENGVHFGHQTNKWNPRMKEYIFGEKGGVYIIDLKKTEEALTRAVEFLETACASGKTVLFVGTKKQAKNIIKEEAGRCGMFFVKERWLGGCLTNFATIRKSVERLDKIQKLKEGEAYQTLTKKEKARIDREEYKLLKNFEGIRDMRQLPDCLVIIDQEMENIAIKEARKAGIPIVALIDTNCDPTGIEYPIPGNDDAIRSIRYIISTLADAVEKGSKGVITRKKEPAETKEEKAEDRGEITEDESRATGDESRAAVETKEEETPEEEPVRDIEDEDIVEGDIKIG